MTFPSERAPDVLPPGAPRASIDGQLIDTLDRHPTALGRHLDTYLAAVARELEIRGVLTGAPQRSDPPIG